MSSDSQYQCYTIGIFGSNGKTSTINMLYCIFNSAGLYVETINSEKYVAQKRNMPNIEPNKMLKRTGNNDIILIEINEDSLKNPDLFDISFDMLIHCHISEDSYEGTFDGANKISSLINSPYRPKVVILNTDDNNWRNVIIDAENTYVITYGFGSKATVTASSIECGKDINFQYCLQRSIANISGKIIEPMEVPIKINVMGQYNVYNGLCAITAGLYCGLEIDDIGAALANKINNTGLRMLYENGFGVLYNICDYISSYESGFEAVQNLPYKNIMLVFNIDTKNSEGSNEKIIDLIGAWSLTLKIRCIYIILDGADILRYQGISAIKNFCKLECIDLSNSDIEGIINTLKDDDMLLFFCSSSYNNLRDKIIDILDKRILGKLSGYNA